ncbi:MAG: sigma 54-interacting transcriptional regulator [SAR324 cluster bacterium]|nr:sigma 54-interacting transcriptional regulator [SAR324 cluster bacterium]
MGNDNPVSLENYDDILERINFDSKNGHIWLADRRMMLIQTETMELLRKELIQTLGFERAQGVLMRMGFAEGVVEARWARKLRAGQTELEMFHLGPQLHKIKGCVEVKAIVEKIDLENGDYYAEYLWENSFAAENYLKEWGKADVPVCWHMLGYAIGYTSSFMGRQIIFKEVQCKGTGAEACKIVGKPAEDWDETHDILQYLEPDNVADQLFEMQEEILTLRESISEETRFEKMIGASPAFKKACSMISKASSTTVTLMLLGDTGSGKEMFARAAHSSSPRAKQIFVAVNCGAISANLIEAELFGVEKGAFTGADQLRIGRFERADKGTLFLDEVGELSLAAQASLLRALQEGEIERVGGQKVLKVDVRVIVATNRDLAAMVKKGDFREDLYYRLNVFPVVVPSLKERSTDIPLLANHFLQRYSNLYSKHIKEFSQRSLHQLITYDWPGNIRELENLVERGVILAESYGNIESEHLFPHFNVVEDENQVNSKGKIFSASTISNGDIAKLIDQGMNLEEHEHHLIQEAMRRSDQVVSKAARLLGLSRPAMAYRLKKFGIVE